MGLPNFIFTIGNRHINIESIDFVLMVKMWFYAFLAI